MKSSQIIPAVIFAALVTTSAHGVFAKAPTVTAGALNIAAVVNDKAISSFDVDNRIKFILATTRLSNTPDTIAKIRPQIIRTLIDESLQMQEAEKNNIKVEDKEVTDAIASIEGQRQMMPGEIGNMLRANNIPEKTFNDQVRAQMAWAKIMSKFIRPRIKVSDEEVTLNQGRVKPSEPATNISIKEMQISLINLPIDKPSRAVEIKKLGDKLYSELQKGANFREIARQFSAGGDSAPFWIAPEQLDPNIAQVLRKSKEGAITPPIPTNSGLSIIKLLNIRANKNKEPYSSPKDNEKDYSISLKEILLKLKPDATPKEADVLLQIGAEVAKNPGSCEDKTVADVSDLDSFNIEVNMRKTTLSELPPALRGVSENLKVGEVSTPFASTEGIRMYMLCDKKEISGKPVNNDQIKEVLFRQKYELEAQKYLRNLQRNAFIEVRQ